MKDVIIIGGGAAGLCAAIKIKRLNPALNIVIAEQLDRVAKKLITTGNGRCNMTNSDCDIRYFHGNNPEFCRYAIETFDNEYIENFFGEMGIMLTYDERGRAYPYSLQASSVVDALRFTAGELGIEILTNTKITDIKPLKNGYRLFTFENSLEAKCILVAAGLYSGGEKLGSDGSVLRILRDKLRLPIIKTTPAIVQLKTDPSLVRSLKGIKVNATASIYSNNSLLREEFGEVLFCDYGLSGPAIMQISREVERSGAKFRVCLDLMPEYEENALVGILKTRTAALSNRACEDFFTGMLNKRLGQYVLKRCGFSLGDSVSSLCGSERKICECIKSLTFDIISSTGFINSQVTAGGLDTSAFSPRTMMAKDYEGLFAAGEILDIDGDCGGYNLRWAWSSAICAAMGICKYLEENK